jgi:hypothetical protein
MRHTIGPHQVIVPHAGSGVSPSQGQIAGTDSDRSPCGGRGRLPAECQRLVETPGAAG